MPTILLENDNDPTKGKKPDAELHQPQIMENKKPEGQSLIPTDDDFAIFPEWDVIPPNAIINPRLKKKI